MKALRVVAVVALALLSIGAIMGAVLFIQNPLGSPMQIPLNVLDHSPFHSFLIPGILLLVSQGLLPLVVMASPSFASPATPSGSPSRDVCCSAGSPLR